VQHYYASYHNKKMHLPIRFELYTLYKGYWHTGKYNLAGCKYKCYDNINGCDYGNNFK